MDLSSDFEPPFAGSFDTTIDCGLLGSKIPVHVTWELNDQDAVRIHSIEVWVIDAWKDLYLFLNPDFAAFGKALKDPDLLAEANLDYERDEAQYRAEFGSQRVRVL